MDQGWVYVFVNSSIPGMAKVGRTTRPPVERAAELSAATGVATPFIVAFDQPFEDCAEAERLIHGELERRGLRIAPNREFFRGAPSEIVRIVMEVADRSLPARVIGPAPSAERLRLAGDCALFGHGDTLQDMGEALRLYKLAGARGSLIAFERMGQIYNTLYLELRDRPRRRRSLNALREGARRGNYYCYCELAVIYAAERHIANFVKAWDLFFVRRTEAYLLELENEPRRFSTACARYLGQALELGVRPSHQAELAAEADNIMATLRAEIDAARSAGVDRQWLTTSLRWAYENLHFPPKPIYLTRAKGSAPSPNWISGPAIASA